jgi:hypothetical protein
MKKLLLIFLYLIFSQSSGYSKNIQVLLQKDVSIDSTKNIKYQFDPDGRYSPTIDIPIANTKLEWINLYFSGHWYNPKTKITTDVVPSAGLQLADKSMVPKSFLTCPNAMITPDTLDIRFISKNYYTLIVRGKFNVISPRLWEYAETNTVILTAQVLITHNHKIIFDKVIGFTYKTWPDLDPDGDHK